MKKFIKILLWSLATILILVISVMVFLLTPPGKRVVRNVAVDFLENKFQTPVIIGDINYKIPTMVSLDNVIFVDKNADTLLSLNHLQVDIAMLQLLKGKLKVHQVDLEGLYAQMKRNSNDTTFNYQYIIDAFASANVDTTASKEVDTSATAILYEVGKVRLKDITFIFNDEAGGTYFDVVLDSILLRPKEIDPSKMIYRVEDLIIYKADAQFKSFVGTLTPPEEIDTGSASSMILEAENLKIIQSSYTMLTRPDSFYLDVNVGNLAGKLDLFDLLNQEIIIDAIELQNSNTTLTMGIPEPGYRPIIDTKSIENVDTGRGWLITANKLSLKDIFYKMDDESSPRLSHGVDYSHLDLKNVSLIADDIYFTVDSMSTDLTHLALKEKSGLEIRELKSKVAYHEKGAILEDLYLLTPHTLIQDKLEIKYPSLEAISQQMEQMYLDVMLSNSHVGFNDILLFAPPSLYSTLSAYKNKTVHINGGIFGYFNNLQLDNILLKGPGSLHVDISGNLKGLPNPDHLSYDLDIRKLNAAYADIKPFIPKSLEDNIRIPQTFAINGTLHGTLNTYHPDLNIQTSDGSVSAKGMVDISKTGSEKFDLVVNTQSLNLGKILKQDTLLGIVTMTGIAKGTGFDIKTMKASVEGQVERFDFNGYAYSNANLNADIDNQVAKILLDSKDPNATVNLVADVDLNDEYPAVTSKINVGNVNLKALGFLEDLLVLGGDMDINFSDLNPKQPKGFLSWRDPIINYDGKILDVDSIYLSSQPSDSGQNIIVYIDNFLNASLRGNIPLTDIGTVALSHINKYFKLSDTLDALPQQYDMLMELGIKQHPTIATFVPDLTSFDTIGFTAIIQPNEFSVKGIIPNLIYGDHNIVNLLLDINDDEAGILKYDLTLDEYFVKDGLQINKPTVFGYLKNDSLYANIKTFDYNDVENYALGIKASSFDNKYFASLSGPLKLNYDNWDVSNNLLSFSDSGFFINNLGISKGNESILIGSKIQSQYGSPLNINIKNFEIANVTKILNPDTLLAEGTLQANFDLDLSDTFPRFVGDLGVTNLTAFETPIGNLKANASNLDANSYQLDATIFENNNDIQLAGLYHIQPINGNNFDLKLGLNSLSLKQFEGLAFGHLKDSDGFLRGQLDIKGTIEKPAIDGQLKTDQLQTRIAMINSLFSMPNETITISNKQIRFEDFKILDSLGQQAVLSGVAKTEDFKSFDLNLNFNANKWQATNSNKTHFESMYGKLLLTSNINITGQATSPSISGNLTLHDSTNFTYAMIDEGPGITEHDGIVEFVDDVDNFTFQEDSNSIREIANQMTMNLNIETEKYAKFNVLVDPITGDMASVHGTAFLNASMMPGGTINLTGTYQIVGGYYELYIELIKRRFEITENSTISLAGDPLQAELNLEAKYEAEIAPYDLMEKIAAPEDMVYYRQRLPFEVIMNITGKPLKPNIRYSIVLPEDKTNMIDDNVANNIQAKLRSLQNDPAELFKQVIGVLTINRFISQDPIQSGGAGSTVNSMENLARQSAGRLLSQQLNNLAAKYVQGVDLSLDVKSQEDFTSGQRENRTSVSLNAQKQFLNDRLTVNIGNDFQVEGRQLPGRESALIPGNISLDYKLTPTGKYTARAYRKNQIQNVIDGYVVETGGAFRLNYAYNRFRELFMSREKLRAYYRKQRLKELEKEEKKNSVNQNKTSNTNTISKR